LSLTELAGFKESIVFFSGMREHAGEKTMIRLSSEHSVKSSEALNQPGSGPVVA
jgi:hypothetical protein